MRLSLPLVVFTSLALLAALPTCGDAPSSDAPSGVEAAESPGEALAGGADPTASPGADEPVPKPWPADLAGDDHPSLVAFASGEIWVAWQSYDGTRDRIELGRLEQPGQSRVIHEAPSHIQGTAVALDAQGALHVVWSERRDDGWALVERVLPPEGPNGSPGDAGPARDIAARPGARLLLPRLASDPEGRLLVAYQVIEGGAVTVEAMTRTAASEWSAPVTVPDDPRSNWFPALCARDAGRFAVAWDRAVDGDYDVLLAELSADDTGVTVDARHRVTDTPRYEAHAAVASHGERLYVAYEVGQERWGREGSTKILGEALHSQRHVEVLAVEDGRVAELDKPFMQRINVNLERGCERPTLLVDGHGNLVLGFRGLPLPPDLQDPSTEAFQEFAEDRAGGGVGWRTSIWFGFLSIYDGTGWAYLGSHHTALPDTEGRGDAELALTRLPRGGVAMVTVGDRRAREEVPEGSLGKAKFGDGVSWWKPVSTRPHRVTGVRVPKGEPVDALPTGPWRDLPPLRTATSADAPIDVRRTSSADGRSLRVALGDLHRHTDMSRCSSNWDGPFTDAVRYAFDVGGLHFLAVTDHFEHLTGYDWWRNLGMMEAFHAPGRMVNLRAYERADNTTGHRNVISGDDRIPVVGYRNQYHPPRDDLRADVPSELWPQLDDLPIITIPHTTAGMFKANPAVFDWLSFEPSRDRVVEMFQGYRGSSEVMGGPRAIDVPHQHRFAVGALDGGLHFGFIASSDHQSTYGSFAGAWVEDLTRTDVFAALYERRTFGATCPMSIWMEWDGAPMGSAERRDPGATSGVRYEVEVFGGRELAQVELIIDGEVSRRRELTGARAEGVFETVDVNVPDSGTRYVYLRFTTADDELGWSSPVRLGPDPSYGADGPPGRRAFGPIVGPMLEVRPSTGNREPRWERWEAPGSAGEAGGR